MEAGQWLERIGGIRQWHIGGTRAPHKPLLVLYALAAVPVRPSGQRRLVGARDR